MSEISRVKEIYPKWEVYLGTDVYPSMKAWKWQCIVWLCVKSPQTFYLIIEVLELE